MNDDTLANESYPPAAIAVATRTHLHAQAGRAIAAQCRRITERCALFIPRPAIIKTLDDAVRSNAGGIVALESPPGGGATAVICRLAANRPWAFWLPEDDDGHGLAALCAQLLALGDSPTPLIPPTAQRDTLALEQLLAEIGPTRPPDDPLVVAIGRMPDDTLRPWPPPLPQVVPPGVTVLLACPPQLDEPLPGIRFAARVALGANDEFLFSIAAQLGCSRALAAKLVERSGGSPLYVRLMRDLLATRSLESARLPYGLAGLHQRWWNGLDERQRLLAALLAATDAPIPKALLATLTGMESDGVERNLRRWGALIEHHGDAARLYHRATRTYIATTGDTLAVAHNAFVELGLRLSQGAPERSGWPDERHLSDRLARHATLRGTATGAGFTVERAWIRAQERRHGDLRAAAVDAAWSLRAAAGGDSALQLVRSAALASVLTFRARSLPPRAPAEIFATAVDRGQPRDTALRRIRAMVDQLPDGSDKALALRHLGEVCYALRMRTPAMRMLSEALDLEAPGPTRQWRDQREETLVALARAAIGIEMPDTALGITTRIIHAERRGMIETEVVRWLIARGRLGRAEEVAYAIGHTGNHEWAMAEVAIGHARAGDYERAGLVLDTLKTATAIAWVTIELACDAARRGNPRAADRVALLPNPALRDRALAQVAVALIVQVAPPVALEAARMIDDHETRARCLIDMAMAHPPTAFQALDEAATAAVAVEGEERASVIAMLAAAEAASGRVAAGLRMAALLLDGEEHDRAQSRIAIALARRGDHVGAEAIAIAISDDDERGWALDELARMLAAAGHYREAFTLAGQVGEPLERARLEADLTIAWARGGEAAAAYARAEQIEIDAERARAQAAITIPLVASGARAHAFLSVAEFMPPDGRSRYLLAAAQALAAHGLADDAVQVAHYITRPLEHTRALAATARAAALIGATPQARELLARALLAAAPLGRAETFQGIAWVAETLAVIGGAELLLAAAAALDEIDGWFANG